MKAKTAERIAIQAELKPIMAQIKEQALNGKYVLYHLKLNPWLVTELERLGYRVVLGGSGTCHYIEWYNL